MNDLKINFYVTFTQAIDCLLEEEQRNEVKNDSNSSQYMPVTQSVTGIKSGGQLLIFQRTINTANWPTKHSTRDNMISGGSQPTEVTKIDPNYIYSAKY